MAGSNKASMHTWNTFILFHYLPRLMHTYYKPLHVTPDVADLLNPKVSGALLALSIQKSCPSKTTLAYI